MQNLIQEIKSKSLELGFDDVGITKAVIPDQDIQAYREWLKLNYQGDLAYMENEIRCAPERLFPGAKTAILFVSYYKQPPLPFKNEAGLIASYARGRKYQNVHHSRLKVFIRWLEKRTGENNIAKAFSDTAPILEKALAVQAGLGWFGKNTLLIHRRFGTFILLAGVLTTLEICLENETELTALPRSPAPKPLLNVHLPRCGACRLCLDACPTGALVEPYKLDARKCLSNHLIESKKELPEEIRKKNPGYLFGCDICQDVCPHNVRKPLSSQKDFAPENGMGAYLTLEQLNVLENIPEKLFGTPLQRRGVKGLQHTAQTFSERQNS